MGFYLENQSRMLGYYSHNGDVADMQIRYEGVSRDVNGKATSYGGDYSGPCSAIPGFYIYPDWPQGKYAESDYAGGRLVKHLESKNVVGDSTTTVSIDIDYPIVHAPAAAAPTVPADQGTKSMGLWQRILRFLKIPTATR